MSTGQFRSHLLRALQRILRSLARTLLRSGVRFDDFASVARAVYIESAVRDFAYHSTPSRERIAAITGLTCTEIDAYIDHDGSRQWRDPALMFLVAEVLRTWHTNPQFLGPYGIPLELRFDTPADRSFRCVVALIDPSADPHVVLDELLRTGAVARSGDTHFRAISRSLMLSEGISPQRIEYHTNALARLAATLEYNMDVAHVDKRLERRVRADRGLSLELLPTFENYAREKANEFLLELDNWLASQPDDEFVADERVDVGVSTFFYVSRQPEANLSTPQIAKSK